MNAWATPGGSHDTTPRYGEYIAHCIFYIIVKCVFFVKRGQSTRSRRAAKREFSEAVAKAGPEGVAFIGFHCICATLKPFSPFYLTFADSTKVVVIVCVFVLIIAVIIALVIWREAR